MSGSEAALYKTVAKVLEIPVEFIPKDLVLQVVGTAKEYKILTGLEPFSSPKWEEEISHLISVLVTSVQGGHTPHPIEGIRDTVASNLLVRIQSGSAEQSHKALLGLLMLVYTHPEAAKIEGIEMTIQEEIIDKYPLDQFLQAAGNRMLNLVEDAEKLIETGTPFEYPPFQKAIPYFPHYGYQATLVFKDGVLDEALKKSLEELIVKLKEKCAEIDGRQAGEVNGKKVAYSGFNVGFELNFWEKWCHLMDREPSVPVKQGIEMMNSDETNFMKLHSKLKYTSGHVWFYLKADTAKDCNDLLQIVLQFAKTSSALPLVTTAYKENEGRIFGGQFLDGISNAVDAISMTREVLIPAMPTESKQPNPEGGTFAFMQFFQFDKTVLSDASQPVTENMIGRDSFASEVLSRPHERCHVKRARVVSPKDGTNTELIRQSLPYTYRPNKEDTSSNPNRGPMSDGLFFVAFGQSAQRFSEILENILGKHTSFFTEDLLIANVQGRFGKLFYCPNTIELEVLPKFTDQDLYPPIPFWSKYTSKNEAYFYNHIQYLYAMSTSYKDPPSKRILYLMSKVFARWHSTWVHKFDVPRIPHLEKLLHEYEKFIMDRPIQARKGYSYKKMLGEVFTSDKPYPDKDGKIYGFSENFDTYRIDPKELIVGVTDRLSLGSGKEVMPYLKEGSERTLSMNLALSEAGNMGHIVPGHNYLLELGVSGLLEKLRKNRDDESLTADQRLFYESAVYAYEGVQLYLLKYARLARKTAKQMKNLTSEVYDRENLRKIAHRMVRLALGDPQTFSFHDAAQMIFSMHCCLHNCGQQVSVGRLDQLLLPYYQKDIEDGNLTPAEAQDIIDAFFIKFDEHAVLNRYNIPYGHTTYGNTAVTGRGGPFATGDSMNQWIQQITVGGCDENGADACNDITLMCLKACRRLPLNAPCVSLRLSKNTPEEVKKAAVEALLSGGAHPILFNDEKTVPGMFEALRRSFDNESFKLDLPDDLLKVARDYSCDGCYEPMYTGRSEFKFTYVSLLQAVIFSLNSGANYQNAGTLNLAGGVSSHRTPLPNEIASFEEFKAIFVQHLKVLVRQLYSTVLGAYGNPWQICPSPLLSCLLEGCVETGLDMTNGGSRFHIITPMYVGYTNAVNSLYNVKRMVFDDNVTTMEMLRMALFNNWGENLVEPFYDATGEGVIHTEMWGTRFKDLRDYALQLPKFGTDTATDEVYDLAEWLAASMDKLAHECLYEEGPIADRYKELREKHSVPGKPFLFQVMTGSGTFESYNSVGVACAATPDGRLNSQPTASDCSAQPYAQDRPLPSNANPLDIVETLKPYNTHELHKYMPNACEIDVNVPEDFSPDALLEFIDAFINNETGSNLVTVTCADTETLERARVEPQKFDLVRNRMGGWSNFFVSMFNSHQLQHIRRPMFGPHKK